MRAFGAPLLLLLLLQATGGVGQRTDFEKITCPVVGSFVKNGLLVPDAAGLITKEQTLAAFLAHGVAPEIAAATTNGNFNGPDCPACPTRIDPFAMNTIADGEQVSSPFNAPQEHFRSTGIRDRAGGQLSKKVFRFGEEACLPEGATAWTLADVLCFADVWDRDAHPHTCPDLRAGTEPSFAKKLTRSNDVSEEKRPAGCGPCDSFLSKPEACRSALTDTIEFMFEAFKNPATGTFAKGEFRKMWVDLEFPTGFKLVPGASGSKSTTSTVLDVALPRTGPLFEDDFENGMGQWRAFGFAGLAPRGKSSASSMKLSKSASATAGPLTIGAGAVQLKVTFDWKTRNVATAAEGLSMTLSTAAGLVLFTEHLGQSDQWIGAEFMIPVLPASDVILGFAMNAGERQKKSVIDNIVVEELA
eukprot:TRINITY_DN270_c0_g1_i3.p1 TRINITY_DN270_c0_g1~~TRINITY_DN270_c0_g1_i3.p1  ORF type:complete len:416 (+),score=136.12 TRINITY_DN270_c0_g1_i3:58-1305(+)